MFLEREIGPEAKDTIVTAGQQLIEQGRKQGIAQGIERSLVNLYAIFGQDEPPRPIGKAERSQKACPSR